MKISKHSTFALLILGMLVASCTKNTPVLPVADFSANSLAIRTDSAVNFTDESTGNPTSWSWSFQGGTPSTSTLQHPTNIQYHAVGSYNVTLTVTNADGSNTKTKSGYIVVTELPVTLPTVSTSTVSSIAKFSAVSGGNISNSGNSIITARGICWSTNPNPTILNNKTTDSNGIGNFISNLSNLKSNTKYYVKAYATNSVGTAYGNEISFTTEAFPNCGTVTDIDGNVYHTVTIGTQCWMVENLNTTRYNDGSPIKTGLSELEYTQTLEGVYSHCNNNPGNDAVYGKLYNWYAVYTGKLAPTGWHVPSIAEWTVLFNYLGGTNYAGCQMKATDVFWKSPNVGASNSSGFSGYPAGKHDGFWGGYTTFNEIGGFWSNANINATDAWWCVLSYDRCDGYLTTTYMKDGYSVRCIKD